MSSYANTAMTAPSSRSLMPGEIVIRKFRIERLIGEGGMGRVYEATHLDLDERVALKFLNAESLESPEIVSRFSNEARAAVKLKSEHVARVLDVGATEEGVPFIVMEYLAGRDLAQELETAGPLPISEAVEFTIHACEALAEAHSRGIVHRDIKPENLFIVERSHGHILKILDFGISKFALTGSAAGINVRSHRTQSVLGSPLYMSPEQLRTSQTLDHRTDIWSLGTVLFEVLTGVTAFKSEEFSDLVLEITLSPHRNILEFRSDVPQDLIEVIDRCLSKDVEERYLTVADLAVALLPFAPERARGSVERAIAMADSTRNSVGQIQASTSAVLRRGSGKFEAHLSERVRVSSLGRGSGSSLAGSPRPSSPKGVSGGFAVARASGALKPGPVEPPQIEGRSSHRWLFMGLGGVALAVAAGMVLRTQIPSAEKASVVELPSATSGSSPASVPAMAQPKAPQGGVPTQEVAKNGGGEPSTPESDAPAAAAVAVAPEASAKPSAAPSPPASAAKPPAGRWGSAAPKGARGGKGPSSSSPSPEPSGAPLEIWRER